MATPPTFEAEYETAWDGTTTPITSMSAVAIVAAELLVGVCVQEAALNLPNGVTENGSSSWVLKQSYETSDYSSISAWTYLVAGNENLTVTYTRGAGSQFWGGNTLRFSGTAGVGLTNKNQGSSGNPTIDLVCSANSSVAVAVSDWNANGNTPTWATVNGYVPTVANGGVKTAFAGSNYGVHIAVYPDVGGAGSKTFGLSITSGMKWNIIAVEVLGAEAAGLTISASETISFTESLD